VSIPATEKEVKCILATCAIIFGEIPNGLAAELRCVKLINHTSSVRVIVLAKVEK